ncbi:hypothetical protein [Phenylobacterium sp.]|uniref:hypothetical protein n=1 Tax=Phenylobacterium sp. TaxID=1871053 RepID=UPI003928C802
MAKQALSGEQKTALDAASPKQVQIALGRFSGKKQSTWVSPTHKYKDGQLPRDFTNSLPPSEITEAVSIRAPLHLIDGWGYLARALNALSSGAPHPARHLAYYAELRAALSILASQGIGIFNTRTVVIAEQGDISSFNGPTTHTMAWFALQNWADKAGAFDMIMSSMDISGVTLKDIFQEYFPSPAKQMLGSELISLWGFDLSVAANDHVDRNTSSYLPNELLNISTNPADDLKFIRDLWRSFQPTAFDLEKHLLRMLLEKQVGQIGRRTLAGRQKEYERIDPRFRRAVTREFIERREEADDHPILRTAASRTEPSSVQELTARACLLLRLALALNLSCLSKVSVSPRDDLEFWWTEYGSSRGFWRPGEEPEDLSELWADVDLALSDAENAAATNRLDWLAAEPSGLPRLCETERICLWALCR